MNCLVRFGSTPSRAAASRSESQSPTRPSVCLSIVVSATECVCVTAPAYHVDGLLKPSRWRRVTYRYLRIGQQLRVDTAVRGHDPAGLYQVTGSVDGQNRVQTITGQPADRPLVASRVTPRDQPFRALVPAGVLHHAAKLLGPEVRHRIVGRRPPHE